jgi:hypothetical protein
MPSKGEPTQQTQPKKGKPIDIPIPTRGDFDQLVKQVAGPVFMPDFQAPIQRMTICRPCFVNVPE